MTDISEDGGPNVLAQGQAFLAAKEYSQAIKIFDEVLRRTPSDFMAVFDRARCYQGLDNWEAAGLGYSEALRIDGSTLASYINRGYCRGNIGDHQGAAEDFERYLDGNPQRVDVWCELAERRLDAGAFARAAEAFERAVSLDPTRGPSLTQWIERAKKLDLYRTNGSEKDFAAACRERGWAKFELGAVKTAITWFNRAIDTVPDDAEAWHGRGVARGRLGQAAEAVADLEKSVRLSPASSAAWLELGHFRSIQENLPAALEAIEEAVCRAPGLARAYRTRATIHAKLNNFIEADSDFSRSIELAPAEGLGWINRGWSRLKSNRFQEAIDDLTKGIELDSTQPLAFLNRGYAHRSLGNHVATSEDFKRAMALDPSLVPELGPLVQPAPAPKPVEPDCDALTRSGIDLMKKGDLDGAIAEYSRALDLDPGALIARHNRGVARQKKGDIEGAIFDYSKAIESNPKDADTVMNRGIARHKKGDLRGAIADYAKSLELDPKQTEVARALRELRMSEGVFCGDCIKESEPGSPGNMYSMNGLGMALYGSARECPNCGSTVRSKWIILYFLPLIPVGTYRIIQTDFKSEMMKTKENFHARAMAFCWPQVLKIWFIGWGIIAVFSGGITALVFYASKDKESSVRTSSDESPAER